MTEEGILPTGLLSSLTQMCPACRIRAPLSVEMPDPLWRKLHSVSAFTMLHLPRKTTLCCLSGAKPCNARAHAKLVLTNLSELVVSTIAKTPSIIVNGEQGTRALFEQIIIPIGYAFRQHEASGLSRPKPPLLSLSRSPEIAPKRH